MDSRFLKDSKGGGQATFYTFPAVGSFYNYSRDLAKVDGNLKVQSNLIIGVEGILQNPTFQNGNLKKFFPGFDMENDRAAFVSAILRFIFSRPNEKLEKLYDKCIGSEMGLNNSLKVGIQFRAGDPKDLVMSNREIDAFGDQLLQDFSEPLERKNITVFVTGDDHADLLNNLIERLRRNNFKVVSSGEYCPQLHFSHIDLKPGSCVSEEKTFLDWFALTQMDRLYISRSGYGETASMLSLVPTLRYSCFSTNVWHFQPWKLTNVKDFEPNNRYGNYTMPYP